MFETTHISVPIKRPADDVYAFASNPENLPQWAAGLSGSIRKIDGDWVAESPMGTIKIVFAPDNVFGVLDHDVTLPSGEVFSNPMRVFPNNDGSELVFTLFRRPGVSDDEFTKDQKMIEGDLRRLKGILEQ